jgi:hypothetical protein
MSFVHVAGWLRTRKRRTGRPDQSLPDVDDGNGGEAPDQGLPVEPGFPGHELPPWVDQELPPSPPGIWPPLTPTHPIAPVPPGTPDHPISLPPGSIWPPISGAPPGTFAVLAFVPEYGWKIFIVQPDIPAPAPAPH